MGWILVVIEDILAPILVTGTVSVSSLHVCILFILFLCFVLFVLFFNEGIVSTTGGGQKSTAAAVKGAPAVQQSVYV